MLFESGVMENCDSEEAASCTVRRNALNGDLDAIVAHLIDEGIDPAIVAIVRLAMGKRRKSVDSKFDDRVRTIVHYRKRGWVKVPKETRIKEMMDLFSLPRNICEHLANGKGYANEQRAAQAIILGEVDSHKL
jgi:hypothetical protein